MSSITVISEDDGVSGFSCQQGREDDLLGVGMLSTKHGSEAGIGPGFKPLELVRSCFGAAGRLFVTFGFDIIGYTKKKREGEAKRRIKDDDGERKRT